MYNPTEKRKYPRIELENRQYKEIETPCIARFHTKQYKDNEYSTTPEWDIVSVKNLSAGGMVFTYDKNLGIDSNLQVKFKISQSIPTISCEGRVVRIEGRQHLSGYFTAIEFTEIGAQTREEINLTVEEILRKKTKKKNFSFNRLIKIVNFMKRSEVVTEPLQEDFPSLQKEHVTEMRACCSCNKSISAEDSAAGVARKHFGQLYCQECSNILRKKKECENTIKNREMNNTESEVVTQRSDITNRGVSDVPIRDDQTEMVNNRIERVENQDEGVYDQAGLFPQNEKMRRVTFRLPRFAAPMANSVYIVGDFNNWNDHNNPMKKERNGDYTLSLDLEPGNNYKFGYLIDSVLVGLSNCSIKRGEQVEENAAICL